MSGHRKWGEIRGPRTPEQEAHLAAGMAAIRLAQRLAAMREERGLTQTAVADRMGVSQPHVAQIEARDDVYLSTLVRYIRALGGDLRLQAVFPGEDPIEVTLDTPMDEQAPEAASATA
jgi:transcriptional regulator with XRE-family HTH domain